MILKDKITRYKVNDESEEKTLLRIITNKHWDEIATFFDPVIFVARNPKSDMSRWNVLKREKAKSHWEKWNNFVQVKVMHILAYGDAEILIDKGTSQCSVDLIFLKKTIRIFLEQETNWLVKR